MTAKLFIALLILSTVLFSGCGEARGPSDTATDNSATETAESAATEITEAEVKEALESLRTHVEKNDTEGLMKTYSDDYMLVTPDGIAETKAQRMEAMKTGKMKYEKVEFKDAKIRTYGNTGIAVFNAVGKMNVDGKDTEMDGMATIVFVKSADGIKEVSAQLTNKAAK